MVMRLGGLATGMDTDTIVKQSLANYQSKIDKVKGDKQIFQWQQETYRDIAASMKTFQTKYFDILNKEKYVYGNFFASTTAKIVGVDNGYLGVTATNKANPGRYEVNIEQEAKGASVSGKITDADILGKTLKINNTSVDMTNVKNVSDLVNQINNKTPQLKGIVKASYSEITGEFKIETVATGGDQTLKVDGTLGLTGEVVKSAKGEFTLIHSVTSGAIVDKDGKNVTSNTRLVDMGFSDGEKITINGQDISVDIDTMFSKIEEVISIDGNVVTKDGKITISKSESTINDTSGKDQFSIEASDGVLKRLGFGDVQKVSSKVSVSSAEYTIDSVKLNDDKKIIVNGIEATISEDKKNLIDSKTGKVIEGIEVSIVSEDTSNPPDSLKDVYKLKSTIKSFNIHPSNTGTSDTNVVSSYRGQDAIVNIRVPGSTSSEGIQVRNSKNDFTVDGITLNIKAAHKVSDIPSEKEWVTFNIESDTDKVISNIKEFVEDYNKLIDDIGSKIYERKQYTYRPLTDEQKEEMSENEIKKWEEKAKQGILKGDSGLESFLTQIRGSMFDKLEGSNINLFEIGINTSMEYSKRGKLYVDDDKLKKALEERPEDVESLFTKNSETSYDADKGYAGNTARKESAGIFRRIEDIFKDAIRTTRNSNNQKGYLLEKAGITGDTTNTENTITKKIKEKDKMIDELIRKMSEKEDRLYKQFANLETMMNYYNSQSSWLTQQLGGM